jgi:hypothetical protein
MVEVLKVTEAEPAAYPAAPVTATVDNATVWKRIEGWVRHRWGEREVVWIVQGPGTWEPPLMPCTVTAAEVWRNSTWESVTLTDDPVGYDLDIATYRITATVGDTEDPPPIVTEAYARLAEYLDQARADAAPGHTSGQDGDYSFSRSAGWAARAIHNSGAGDLLRAFR